MNDRYLCRAKRIDNGEWAYGSYVYTFCEDKNGIVVGVKVEKHWIVEESGNMVWVDEDTICQYTGFNDMNGQKIWENDIFVAHLDENYPEDETYEQVIWHESGFCTMEKNSTDCELLDGFDTRYFAVCGNIFDNAELLEKGK